ncbi:lipopolysaccharide ABC transporter permease [Jannaschia seosinensis]|uniref:Lipopolysaccharide ABC transporter permease n=1 Tax=Jannaschia seosinensis TaxID=313367 RepID=A0A0M7BB66_9RHOB|nr:LPS export ABC transporter permease LptF [Jannaschia seosinensis]CUH39641.1 lipopolysaccharide ABC transporter permease [Jannaschia seosinensis]
MTLFDRYLAGSLMVYFGFFSLVLVAVYWVNRAIGLFDRLIAGGSNLWTFLEFTALALPNVIHVVLPVSALVATLYGLNRLSSDSELTVARTTGIGPWRLARPVLIFGLAVALMVSVLGHLLVPLSRTALAERGDELSRDITARFLQEGEFLHPGTGMTVYVREITERGELLGLFLEDRRSEATRTAYTAESAYLVRAGNGGETRLVMLNGMAQTLDVASRNLVVTRFEDFAYDLASLSQGRSGERRRDPRELFTPALLAAGPDVQAMTGDDVAELRYEGHVRFSEAIFALALPLMALGFLMLGTYSRLGLWRQIVGAVVAAVLLTLLSNIAENAALQDASLWWAIYLPALLTLALGVGLVWRDTRGKRPWRGVAA